MREKNINAQFRMEISLGKKYISQLGPKPQNFADWSVLEYLCMWYSFTIRCFKTVLWPSLTICNPKFSNRPVSTSYLTHTIGMAIQHGNSSYMHIRNCQYLSENNRLNTLERCKQTDWEVNEKVERFLKRGFGEFLH